MANYKKLETLVKNVDATTNDEFRKIVDNENVDVDTLSCNEKLAVLVFAEMQKALETKDHTLVLDCNYAQSKFHNKTDKELEKGQENVWLVDYYRLISKDTRNQSMIQFYTHASAKRGTCTFRLCTSCAKANREQFETLEDTLHFKVIRDKSGRAKTCERQGIQYDELVDVVKAVCAVLAAQPAKKSAVKEDKKEEEVESED